MADLEEPQFRLAGPTDAKAIARLHAESWRRHYRGAYSDAFLDGDVVADRLAVWTDRLRDPDPHRLTILAEDTGLVGFANTLFDDDPVWGALLDNLHVAEGRKRRGIASRLLALTAEAVAERAEVTGLYLWVLEQNVDARAFYEARGGRCVERAPVSPPGGIPSRVTGSPAKLRYAWPAARLAKLEAGAPLRDTAPRMSQANVVIVRRMYEAFQAGDAERALAHFDPDVLVDATGRVDAAAGRGREAVSTIVGSWVASFDEWSEEIEEVRDLGDQVCVVATQRGRGKETGLAVESRYAVLYEIGGDKITRMTLHPDLTTALEAAAASGHAKPNVPH